MTEFSILPELHLYESLSSSLGTIKHHIQAISQLQKIEKNMDFDNF